MGVVYPGENHIPLDSEHASRASITADPLLRVKLLRNGFDGRSMNKLSFGSPKETVQPLRAVPRVEDVIYVGRSKLEQDIRWEWSTEPQPSDRSTTSFIELAFLVAIGRLSTVISCNSHKAKRPLRAFVIGSSD